MAADERLLVIAAGGTGGHMFPAQALADEMLRRRWRVALSTDDRGARFALGFADAVERRVTQAATFSQGGFGAKATAPFKIGAGLWRTLRWFRAAQPAAVIGFGGYPSLPALGAATLLGLPRLIHEQNGVLGRVNRGFATRVDAVACGVWPTQAAPVGARLVHVGNPIRDAARALAGAHYAPPTADGPLRLLIFGGSQGAAVFARLAPPAIGMLAPSFRRRLKVVQQVRPEDRDGALAAYRSMGVDCELSSFFDDMPRRIAEAHLVISRAGASTIAEICTIGRPALLAPYPHATHDHQTANAAALAQNRAAELIPDAETTPEKLSRRLGALFAEPGRLAMMAASALALAKPEAAATLADLVERAARRDGSLSGARAMR